MTCARASRASMPAMSSLDRPRKSWTDVTLPPIEFSFLTFLTFIGDVPAYGYDSSHRLRRSLQMSITESGVALSASSVATKAPRLAASAEAEALFHVGLL